jgi:hypothetical protein
VPYDNPPPLSRTLNISAYQFTAEELDGEATPPGMPSSIAPRVGAAGEIFGRISPEVERMGAILGLPRGDPSVYYRVPNLAEGIPEDLIEYRRVRPDFMEPLTSGSSAVSSPVDRGGAAGGGFSS